MSCRSQEEWNEWFHGETEDDKRLIAEKSNSIYVAFETFVEGNDYVGLAAAKDHAHIERIYYHLKGSWPKATHGRFIG